MKLAIIGYGKMGREIEKLAIERNHEIVLIIDQNNAEHFNQVNLKKADAAIEFTTPDTAIQNITKCFEAGVPVVSGTTGWIDRMDFVKEKCSVLNGTFFYASNFSLGVNILFRMNRWLAEVMNHFNYEVSISETHHVHKKDAPSGTAITLAKGIMSGIKRKTGWASAPSGDNDVIPVESIREGEVFGNHTVRYSSDADIIEISHSARNRRGFALGAVMAAEFIAGKKGVYSMDDMLKI